MLPRSGDTLVAGLLDSQKFRAAVQRGDGSTVEAYIARDPALLYSRDEHDVSAYRLALLAGRADIAKLFVARGYIPDVFDAATAGDTDRLNQIWSENPAQFESRSRDGLTPMHAAAVAGQSSSVEFLAGRGVSSNANVTDPKTKAPFGLTPLRLAVEHKGAAAAERMAQWMLGNGANPNAPQADGLSPLHAAAAAGHAKVVGNLLRKGADAAAKDLDGRTALDVALAKGRDEAAAVLRNAASVRRDLYSSRYRYNEQGSTVTRDDTYGLPQNFINQFVTFAHFDLDRVKKLLDLCPALLMTRATWDELGVEGAAHTGYEKCVRYLLDKGSPLSICTATMMGNTSRVNELLAEDAGRVHERGAHDFPLLWYTAFGAERADLAELLLGAGAEVDTGYRGITTLHLAARKGDVQLAELLLARGANTNPVGTLSFLALGTPLAVAREKGHQSFVDLMLKHGGHA
jgi:ankyrin repeat protein